MLFLCAEEGGMPPWVNWVFVGVLVVLVAALLIVPMFTNKKRAKQESERYNSLRPGDVIKTVGGIIGTVIEIRQVSPTEKELVIETGVGDNKTTMVFDIHALYQIVSKVPAPAAPVSDTATPVADEVAPSDIATEETPVITETANDVAETVENTAETSVAAQAAAEEQAAVAEEPEKIEAIEPNAADETAAASEEPAATEDAAEQPVKKAPAKKTGGTTKSAGKSANASKSTSAGKSTTKKPAKK